MLPSPGGEVSKNDFTLTIVDLYNWVDHVPAQCTLQQFVRFPLYEYDREIRESLGQLGNYSLADVVKNRGRLAGRDEAWL